MTTTDKPLGQLYHEEVEALKTEGMSNADAVRTVAERHHKKGNAVRGGIHQYKRAHLDGSRSTDTATAQRRTRRSVAAPRSVDDYISAATKALEDARDLIDAEVAQRKAELDAAQTRYDEAVARGKDQKADIERRLKALA